MDQLPSIEKWLDLLDKTAGIISATFAAAGLILAFVTYVDQKRSRQRRPSAITPERGRRRLASGRRLALGLAAAGSLCMAVMIMFVHVTSHPNDPEWAALPHQSASPLPGDKFAGKKSIGQSPPSSPTPIPSNWPVKSKITSTVSTPKRTVSSPSMPRASTTVSADSEARTFVADEGKWVNLDAFPAQVTGPVATDPGAPFGLAFGPDNVVPYRRERIWATTSSDSCSVQAKQDDTPSGYAEIKLADLLASTPNSFVRLCTVAPGGNVLALSITSTSGNRRAPYRVEYRMD
jgi:hypothetical protein